MESRSGFNGFFFSSKTTLKIIHGNKDYPAADKCVVVRGFGRDRISASKDAVKAIPEEIGKVLM